MLRNGSLFIFRLFGVSVFIHWSWLLVAFYQVYTGRREDGHSLGFQIAVYLTLFAIVLIHEFGHALACKSVGGIAERIVLWPLGGLAFVQPPPRPGPTLWSIAAGPLVNVALAPLLIGAWFIMGASGQRGILYDYVSAIAFINMVLLVFNLLPIYPLDGGQILQSLLWFALGRGTSMIVSGWIGMIGAVGLGLLGLWAGGFIMALIAVFVGLQSFQAVKIGRMMLALEKGPRHEHARCPRCGQAAPAGAYWGCRCGARFDMIVAGAQCPQCGEKFRATACPLCGRPSPSPEWLAHGTTANTTPPQFPAGEAGRPW
jgi:Zn-dependent protease